MNDNFDRMAESGAAQQASYSGCGGLGGSRDSSDGSDIGRQGKTFEKGDTVRVTKVGCRSFGVSGIVTEDPTLSENGWGGAVSVELEGHSGMTKSYQPGELSLLFRAKKLREDDVKHMDTQTEGKHHFISLPMFRLSSKSEKDLEAHLKGNG